MRQIRDNRLCAVLRIAPDQIVEHAGHGAKSEERPGLMDIEMGRTGGDAHAQHAVGLGVGLGRLELELRAVIFVRDFCRQTEARREAVSTRDEGRAALQKLPASLPARDLDCS